MVHHGGDIYNNKVNLDFSVNINPLGMPESVKRTLCENTSLGAVYPDISCGKLLKAVSIRYGVKESDIIFGSGASELFMAIVHALRPKSVSIPIPSFYGYEYAANAVNAQVTYTKKTEDKAELVFIGSPNNPDGRICGYDVMKNIDSILVIDESFIEFAGEEYSLINEYSSHKNMIIVRSFTKAYCMPGIRLAWCVCADEKIREKIRKNLPEWNVSSIAQQAGVMCLSEDEYLIKTRELIKKEREIISAAFDEMGLKYHLSNVNFMLIESELPLYDELLKKGILIRDCSDFKGLRRGYYRIAVRTHEENEILLKALEEIIHDS